MKKRILALVLGAALCLGTFGCGDTPAPPPDGGDATYIVSFSGESISVPFQEVKEGEHATRPADPVRNGYTFDGWYFGTSPFVFETTPVYGDMQLVGKWSVKQTGGEEVDPNQPTVQTIQMLRDPKYTQGFRVTNSMANTPPGTYLGNIYYNQNDKNYQWTIAQWAIKKENLILPDTTPTYKDGKYWFTTASQNVGIDPVVGEVYMEQKASLEYDHTRVNGEEWPHMLIEQGFHFDWNNPTGSAQAVRFDKMDALRLKMDFTILEVKDMTPPSEYNASLHAAQFQWYCTMHNINPESPDYQNCIWFGFQFYDNREKRPGGTIQVDGGKESATGMAIVVPKQREYMEEPVEIGVETHLEIDMLPLIATWLEKVKDFGEIKVFQNTDIGDLAMTSMNLGWELPGTFDVKSTLKNLSIEYDVKQ